MYQYEVGNPLVKRTMRREQIKVNTWKQNSIVTVDLVVSKLLSAHSENSTHNENNILDLDLATSEMSKVLILIK